MQGFEELKKEFGVAMLTIEQLQSLIKGNNKALQGIPGQHIDSFKRVISCANDKLFNDFRDSPLFQNSYPDSIRWKDTNISLSFDTFNKEMIAASFNPGREGELKETINFLFDKTFKRFLKYYVQYLKE